MNVSRSRSRSDRPRNIARAARRIAITAVCAMVLVLAIAGAANAYTIKGGDRWHRQMVREVLEYNPDLLALVELVWPNFTVNINYGGRAMQGVIDVNKRKWGKSFTDMVIHEFSHEVQLAADATKGGIAEIDCAWRQFLINKGFPERWWVWRTGYPHYGRLNPFECFAENMSTLWPVKYHYAPDTRLVRLNAAQMMQFLVDTGVLP